MIYDPTAYHRDSRFIRLCVLTSQALNVIAFNGSPDETVSGRAWREGATCPVWEARRIRIDRVFACLPVVGHENHCQRSHLKDVAFAEMITENPRTE